MRQVGIFSLSLVGAVALLVFSSAAQALPEVLDACRDAEPTIVAAELPELVEPGSCPVGERSIVDHGIGVILPEPGEGVYAEALTTAGAQELQVTRYENGTIEIEHAGDDSEGANDPAPSGAVVAASSPPECRDRAFNGLRYRMSRGLSYHINLSTVPRNLKPAETVKAIRNGTANVVTTRNACRLGDRVPVGFAYAGKTARRASFSSGRCLTSDGVSVVSFGSLQRSLAVTCTYYGASGFVLSSDVKIDRSGTRWTTSPNSRHCRDAFDLAAVMTHERGHTFGLGHVAERFHANLTMSPLIKHCQSSERSLGRGDVLGLDSKYP